MKSLRLAFRFVHREKNSIGADKSSKNFNSLVLIANMLLKQR